MARFFYICMVQINTNKKAYLIITTALLISITIRLPNINRPLSKHHEFNTAMVLNVCNSWDIAGGPSTVHFTPIIYYANAGDSLPIKHFMINNGKLYYTSFGPFQFILPYYFFKFFQLNTNIINLQIFNLLLHIIIVFVFFFILKNKFKNNNLNRALISTVVFIFLPNYLWFFSNAYSHESLAIVFYLLFVYLVLSKKNFKNLLILLCIVCCGILTDWFMCFLVFFYCIFLLYNLYNFKSKQNIIYIISLIVTSFIAIFFIYNFYSAQTNGAFVTNVLFEKFKTRSASSNINFVNILNLLYKLFFNFCTSYFVLLLFIIVLLTKVKIINLFLPNYKNYSLFFLLTVIIPIIYNLLFLEFTTRHDYSFLKIGIGLIFYFYYLINLKTNDNKKNSFNSLVVYCILSVILYYQINGVYWLH